MVYVSSTDPGKVTIEGGGAGWAGKEVALMRPSGAFGVADYRCRHCCDGTRDSICIEFLGLKLV